uniref:Phospholipase B-like n=1 Tax=Ditylenchus dipsaci TaxID=166011 RepID=A0A915DNQ2_9BILA
MVAGMEENYSAQVSSNVDAQEILGFSFLIAQVEAYYHQNHDSINSEQYYKPKVNVLEHRVNKKLRSSHLADGLDEEYTYKQVCIVNGKTQVLDGLDCRKQVAVARYKNSINATGWSYLEIETKAGNDELLQAYSAGLLEGILSKKKKFNKTKDPIKDGLDGKCSGLVKVAPNNEDIFISQLYKLDMIKASILDTPTAAIETTVSVFNRSLLDEIKPVGQLHCWVRAIAANQLARTGREWCQLFKRYNSAKTALPDYGLLYVLEQMPGLIVYRDLSGYLKKTSYFASYTFLSSKD